MKEELDKHELIAQQHSVAKKRSKRLEEQEIPKDIPKNKNILLTWRYWVTFVAILIIGFCTMCVVFFNLRSGGNTVGDKIAKFLALVAMEITFCKDFAELIIEEKYNKTSLETVKKVVKTLIEYLIALGLITWIFMPINRANLWLFVMHPQNMFSLLFPLMIQGFIVFWIGGAKKDKIKWLAD